MGRGRKNHKWKCRCNCGNEVIVYGKELLRGHCKSCGCLHEQQMARYKTINLKHGKASKSDNKSAYNLWCQIKRRCNNPSDVSYRHYGARGIKLWSDWENDPKAFCDYVESLENFGDPGMTIDRIDVNRGYEPGNLRWITLPEQQRNKTNNRWIECFGKKLTITDWANETGIDRRTISARLRAGWQPERALSIKPRMGGHYE